MTPPRSNRPSRRDTTQLRRLSVAVSVSLGAAIVLLGYSPPSDADVPPSDDCDLADDDGADNGKVPNLPTKRPSSSSSSGTSGTSGTSGSSCAPKPKCPRNKHDPMPSGATFTPDTGKSTHIVLRCDTVDHLPRCERGVTGHNASSPQHKPCVGTHTHGTFKAIRPADYTGADVICKAVRCDGPLAPRTATCTYTPYDCGEAIDGNREESGVFYEP